MPLRRNRTRSLPATEAEARARMGELVLVDVREHDERAAVRPTGSRHIPLAEISTRLGEMPKDLPLAFVCRSGSRSQIATRTAADCGLTAANVRGGLLAWMEAGLPVEYGPQPGAAIGEHSR